MNPTRREWLRLAALATGSTLLLPALSRAEQGLHWLQGPHEPPLRRADFGPNFVWGTATAAYQIEGAWNVDGKGPSIWDEFVYLRGKIADGTTGDVACDFYHRYADDIRLMREMGIPAFRFSFSWSRLLPEGTGRVNPKGIDFYNRVIDTCLEHQVQPWVTCYHWDLPLALHRKGGWPNRNVLGWFRDYVQLLARLFGDRVKHWMVFNEPGAFVGLGYLAGIHAPGHRRVGEFMAATHHVNLAQGQGARLLKTEVPGAQVGTTYSCSPVHPLEPGNERHLRAAQRLDALVNRLYLEPPLGKGYPWGEDGWQALQRIERYIQPGDLEQLPHQFDFHGLQNYFRVVTKPGLWPPLIWAKEVKPHKRGTNVEITDMGWEVYPESLYEMLKTWAQYPGIRRILVTENGAAFPDVAQNGQVTDPQRLSFLQRFLAQVRRAQQEGVPVEGYFWWSFMDNFEWAFGYKPRFGLVHVDFATQQRTVKASGQWFSQFLKER